MPTQVPSLSIIFMIISCATAFILPVGLLLWLRVKKHADLSPFFVGCIIMFLSAFVLERAAHQLILGGAAGAVIQKNLLLYALYGGLMAGLFEETGRFVAFHTALRKKQDKDINALMYGAGHGGLEAMVILGIASINNIVLSLLLNAGQTETVTASLSGDALTQTEAALSTLTATLPRMFLMGAVERVLAMVLQIALSVLVWFAAKRGGKKILYLLAILLHTAVDALTVLLSGLGLPVPATESILLVMTVFYAVIAWRVWNKASLSAAKSASESASPRTFVS